MKLNYFKLFAGIPLILCCLFLSSCKIMTPSDYKRLKKLLQKFLKKMIFMAKLPSLSYPGLP